MKYFLIVVLILAAFVGGYFVSQKYNFKLEPKNSATTASPTITQPLVGNDRDVHGCIGSAGYSWCEAKQKCLRTWEESCTPVTVTPTVDESQTLKAAVKQQLVIEHGNSAEGLVITIYKIEGDFARGMATEQGGGGIWLARKVGGSWQLVFDGNGVPDCTKLKTTYLFPATVLTGVCD